MHCSSWKALGILTVPFSKIQWSWFRWVLPYLRGYLSFHSVYFEQKHFSTLVLPSCRLKWTCEFLPAFCTVWLVVVGVKLLSHLQMAFVSQRDWTQSHTNKRLFVTDQELSQADHHQNHLQSLRRFYGAGRGDTQLQAYFSFLKLKYLCILICFSVLNS